MDSTEGMVAVVRGLRDAGLAVTLLDGAREYTLIPNSFIDSPPVAHKESAKHQSTQHYADSATDYYIRNVGAQVTDGRYTSTYRRSHCHVKPTSPPIELTEFPPQRAELCPGHGNFEVGGGGSGETHSPIRASGKYRGGMVWPDRGSVCSPRASSPPVDHFARSLRKYPCMSPERSTEVVERLVNYTQSKSSARTHTIRNQTLPQRLSDLSSSFDYPKSSRHPSLKTPTYWEPAINILDKERLDESPTRESKAKNAEGDGPDPRKPYNRNYDVKCLRDIAKRIKDGARMSAYPYTQPVCPHIRDSSDNRSPSPRLRQPSTNKANTEIQAVVRMVSKEVATVPIVPPPLRTVAVALSPTSSITDRIEGECRLENKSNQTTFSSKQTKKRKSDQTVSVTELPNKEIDIVSSTRKIRSQEQINITDEELKTNLLEWFGNIDLSVKTQNKTKEELLKMSFNVVDGKKIPTKFNSSINSILVSRAIHDRDELKKEINLTNYDNTTTLHQAEISTYHNTRMKFKEINTAIKYWLKSIPLKGAFTNEHRLCRDVDTKRVYYAISNMFRDNMINYFENDTTHMRSELLEIIRELPVEVGYYNESLYLNKIVDSLLDRINNIFNQQNYDKRNITVRNVSLPYKFKNYPTEENLKLLIRKHLIKYAEKYNLGMCKHVMQDIQNELTDIFINSIDWLCSERNSDFRFQMKYILTDVGDLAEIQADNFIDDVLYELARGGNIPTYNKMYTILPNTLQNSSLNSNNAVEISDFSIEGITQGDLDANLELYIHQLCEQIDGWLINLNVNQIKDEAFRRGVVRDLAGDIVNRQKYLEINPSNKESAEDESEHLKYLIFKWINKLVGENNTETIHHTEKLMQLIRNVPIPRFPIPENKNMTCHCQGGNSCQGASPKCSGSNKIPKGNPMNSGGRMSSPGGISSRIPDIGIKQKRRLSSPGTFSPAPMMGKDTVRPEHTIGQRNLGDRTLENLISIQPFLSPNPMGSYLDNSGQTNRVEQSQWAERQDVTSGQANGVGSPREINSVPMVSNASIIGTYNATSQRREMSNPGSSPFGPININKKSNLRAAGSEGITLNTECPSNACSLQKDTSYQMSPCIKKVNEEYDEYLKQWIREIPIAASTPEEIALAEKLRLGIYNGIWKALTKLRFDHAILTNRFYYQDVLDDEIEELLNLLPKSPELEKKKHMMKAKLIENTSNTNELILKSAAPSTYKQQLVENVEYSLPVTNKNHILEDSEKAREDLLILNLVENFILYTKYKVEDGIQAQAYKNKLFKNTEELVQNVKHHHGKELKDIDPELYINKIITAMNEVPVPNENIAREEADETLLGIEIGKWFSDLPLVESNSYTEELQKRRLQDSLAKKIHEILKERNLLSDSGRRDLNVEITKFLDKLALKEGTDKSFIMDELINRLKNKPKESIRRKSVAFKDSEGFDPHVYQDFRENMPACSSLIEQPGISNGIQYNNSYLQPSRNPELVKVNKMPSEVYPQVNYQTPGGETTHPNGVQFSTGSLNMRGSESKDWSRIEPSGERWVSVIEITPELAHYVISANKSQSHVDQPISPHLTNQIATGMPPGLNDSSPGPKNLNGAQPYTDFVNGVCCSQPACQSSIINPIDQDNLTKFHGASIPDSRNLDQIAGGGIGILGTSQFAGPSGVERKSANIPSNQGRKLYEMAGGGMGILGTSQVAGPSGIKHYVLGTSQGAGSSGVEHYALGTSQVVEPSGVKPYQYILPSPTRPGNTQNTGHMNLYRFSDPEGIQETISKKSNIPENVGIHSTQGRIPVDQAIRYSTLQQTHQPVLPQRPTNKTRPLSRPFDDGVRRRLEMEESEGGRIEKEKYERCRCMDRLRRRRKPTICPCDDNGIHYPRFIPIMYPYPYFL